jgi:anaerobic selenocysteine-containing dehydrogenase
MAQTPAEMTCTVQAPSFTAGAAQQYSKARIACTLIMMVRTLLGQWKRKVAGQTTNKRRTRHRVQGPRRPTHGS